MDKEHVRMKAAELYDSLPGNILSKEMDIDKAYVGISMYDAPIIGFGAADDPLFEEFKKTGIIGPWHMSPREWLPEAKTVISLFFPMSAPVRLSNRESNETASVLWTYARIEGQEYIHAFMKHLAEWFDNQGILTCVPAADSRFQQVSAGKGIEGYPDIKNSTYGSRWSERHAAFVSGLGTFGLSKGLITRKGMAGRFGSVIVEELFPFDVRPYSGTYDYCTRCGACITRCPAQAIDLDTGKDHTKCGPFVKSSGILHHPRYGCGSCQTGVPCEASIPGKN